MFRRGFFLLAMLGAAAAVPYTMFDGQFSSTVKQKWNRWVNGQGNGRSSLPTARDADETVAATRNEGPSEPGNDAAAPLAHDRAISDLHEVIRFDIAPSWVTSRWPRVSTTLAEVNLQGLRVALVSGTDVDDVTGSLTYYFDNQQRVQRITLHGHTGDERKLAALVKEHFGLRQQRTLGAGLYLSRWNGKPTGVLRLAHAPVVRADSPHSRLQVTLEINRPGAHYGLSDETQRLLDGDKQARRW